MEYNKDIQKERETLELAKYMAKHARTDIEECDMFLKSIKTVLNHHVFPSAWYL